MFHPLLHGLLLQIFLLKTFINPIPKFAPETNTVVLDSNIQLPEHGRVGEGSTKRARQNWVILCK